VKKLLVILGFLSFFVGSVVRGQDKAGHAGDTKHVVVRPDAIKWGPAPPSLPPGFQMVVLVGDPSKPGVPYVLRAKLPDGYRVPLHWHPNDENVTVLQGTLLVGKGEKLDPSKVEELPAGSFWHMPKAMRHFAIAKGETITQTHGIGPFDVHYVNPADDPRKKEDKK
jgi:quercetin dioxygenase-like cupin family protein